MTNRFGGNGGRIAALVGLSLGAIITGLGTIGALTTAVHPSASGESRTTSVAVAVGFLVVFRTFAYAAVHAEHQLRHARSASGAGAPVPAAPPVWSVGPGARRHGPVAQALTASGLLAGSIFCFVLAVTAHADADKSALTQSKGKQVSAEVVSVEHVAHQTRYSTWYSALITVREPSGALTVVHDPQDTDLGIGSLVQVLVDPKDPGYAEFPGQPAATTAGWLVAILGGVLFGLADVQMWRGFLRMRHGPASLPAAQSPAASVAQGA